MKENNSRTPGGARRSSPGREHGKQSDRKERTNSPITKIGGIDGKEKIKEWIKTGVNDEMHTFARAFGEYLAGKSKEEKEEKKRLFGEVFHSASVRRFFSDLSIATIHYDFSQALLLRPRLNYLAGESGGPRAKAFVLIADAALETALTGEEDDAARTLMLKNLELFIEITLSYHKAAGGK